MRELFPTLYLTRPCTELPLTAKTRGTITPDVTRTMSLSPANNTNFIYLTKNDATREASKPGCTVCTSQKSECLIRGNTVCYFHCKLCILCKIVTKVGICITTEILVIHKYVQLNTRILSTLKT